MFNRVWKAYNSMGAQAKSAVWFAMCSILQKGISFITVPIFTRLLTTDEYGMYSLYLSWLQIFTVITSLYLYHGVFNNGMTKFEHDRDRYISSMQGLTFIITIGWLVIYIINYHNWSKIIGVTPVLMFLMFIEMIFEPALQFWSGRQRFELNYKKLVYITLAKSLMNPLLGLLFVHISEQHALARIVSVVLTEVLFCGIIMIKQYMVGKCFIHLMYWKYALKIAIPLIPHYLSGIILNQGDRIMIDRMVGKSEVAFYSVAYSIGMLVQIVTSSIINSFTPWMYKKIKEQDLISIKNTINILLIITGVITFGLMMLSPELITIFGSKEYGSAAYAIPPVAASVYFIFLYNMLAIPQFYYEHTRFLAISSILAAVVNVILNYVFIKTFGYIAAGYTTLVCYVLYAIGHYFVSKKVMKQELNGQTIFDFSFVLLLSLVMILIGIGCNLLFKYWYIRYLILVLILISMIIYRKKIICFFSQIKKN